MTITQTADGARQVGGSDQAPSAQATVEQRPLPAPVMSASPREADQAGEAVGSLSSPAPSRRDLARAAVMDTGIWFGGAA